MHGPDVRIKDAPRGPHPPAYSSRIIKAGALLPDARTFLAHWDLAATMQDNIDRIRRDNLLGKASRSRVEDILAIFRQRYLAEPGVTRALVALVRGRLPAQALDRILYFHAARADRLLRDVVIEVLAPLRARGLADVDPGEVGRTVAGWVREGKAGGAWSENTVVRVTQGLLSALRDFGILRGAARKQIAPAYLPVEAFAYVAYYLG